MKILTAAFLGIYTKDNENNIHILLINRWDGKIGFVGGFVGDDNKKETIKEALIREAKEEIGFDIEENDIEIKYKKEYKDELKKLILYFVPIEISYEKFYNILREIPNSEHFLYETMGYNIFTINIKNLNNFKENNIYKNFIKNNLATDVKEELNYLLENIKKQIA